MWKLTLEYVDLVAVARDWSASCAGREGRGVVLGDIVRQLTYVSGLVPGERLFSVTSYLEKICV